MSAPADSSLTRQLDSLATRHVVLFGGKGGVGKTTISAAAALHYAKRREVILFTSDPASNLHDLFGESPAPVRIEALDADALYARFLETHLESFLEIGDRGTYLDREELRRFFELAIPGIDELMAWMHIGELAEENPQSLVVVDTAPTGHTVRMLSSSEHFRSIAAALDAMQEKHRAMIRQFARREVRDGIDRFIEEFDARARRRQELLTDAARAAFVPVTLDEPLVLEQTSRLMEELRALPIPFVVVNRWRGGEVSLARPVVYAAQSCVPLDTADRLLQWFEERSDSVRAPSSPPVPHDVPRAARIETTAPVLFLAGKGGVGKTSCSASIALQLAERNPGGRYVVISVDPAHSLRDLFADIDAPSNLAVEIVDTKAKWRRFRETFGERIENAVDSLTPRGLSVRYDAEAMRQLIELAPPGADELFAMTRLHDLITDRSLGGVIVDTAPTGHFLRLLDLPKTAGAWVREFMRLLLEYRELIPAGSLGEELVRASREMREIDAVLHSDRAAVIVVTRPERIVLAETTRLLDDLRKRGIATGGVIANAITPENDDACDQSLRAHELAVLASLDGPVLIERRSRPPRTAGELRTLVPL